MYIYICVCVCVCVFARAVFVQGASGKEEVSFDVIGHPSLENFTHALPICTIGYSSTLNMPSSGTASPATMSGTRISTRLNRLPSTKSGSILCTFRRGQDFVAKGAGHQTTGIRSQVWPARERGNNLRLHTFCSQHRCCKFHVMRRLRRLAFSLPQSFARFVVVCPVLGFREHRQGSPELDRDGLNPRRGVHANLCPRPVCHGAQYCPDPYSPHPKQGPDKLRITLP